MTRRITLLPLVLLLLCLSLGSALAQREDAAVKISPNTISDVPDRSPRNVTVHADVPYADVDGGHVTLEGIYAVSIFPDDRGDLVAKFPMADIQRVIFGQSLSGGTVTLRFAAAKWDGSVFSGTDDIRIVSCRRNESKAALGQWSGTFRPGRTFSRLCSQP
jgi:hypothetical protein